MQLADEISEGCIVDPCGFTVLARLQVERTAWPARSTRAVGSGSPALNRCELPIRYGYVNPTGCSWVALLHQYPPRHLGNVTCNLYHRQEAPSWEGERARVLHERRGFVAMRWPLTSIGSFPGKRRSISHERTWNAYGMRTKQQAAVIGRDRVLGLRG